MSETTTLNVRMDAETKREFSAFCEELGMSASSLMNVFARTVVRNREVPFSLTTKMKSEIPMRYRSIFPQSEADVFAAIDAASSVPVSDCVSSDCGVELIKGRMGW